MRQVFLAKTKGKRKLFDRPQRWLRYLSGRIAGTHGPAENTRAPAAPQPCAVRTVADALPPIASVTVPADINRVARVRRRTPGAAKPLQRTAAAVRAALSQPVARSSATTSRASRDRRGLAHFRAVAFCYRVLAGRRQHYFSIFKRMQSICHLLGYYPREVMVATHHSPMMFSVLQNRQCLVDWA